MANESKFNQCFKSDWSNNGIGGFTWSKADALLRSVGANIDEFLPTFNVAGKTIGVVGGVFVGVDVLISGTKLYVGFTDDAGFNWDDDGWDVVQFGLAIAGGSIALAGSGVVIAISSMVIGGISLGVSLYTENQEIQNKQQFRQSICN